MRAEAILFDKDGTLFDFQKTWSGWIAGLILDHADGDASVAAGLSEVIGFDLEKMQYLPNSIAIAGTALQTAEKVLHYYPGMTAPELARSFDEASNGIIPVEVVELAPFLDGLIAMGLPLGVATNDGEASARSQLDHFNITNRFQYIAGYDSGFGAKPNAGMCRAFSDQLGIDPSRVAMIGDSLHDLHSGRAAGMICVGVLTGVATEDDLRPAADVVLPDISHLPAWLQGQG